MFSREYPGGCWEKGGGGFKGDAGRVLNKQHLVPYGTYRAEGRGQGGGAAGAAPTGASVGSGGSAAGGISFADGQQKSDLGRGRSEHARER